MKSKEIGIHDRIKMIRKKKGMTLEEFGKEVLNANKSVVSKWERGLTVPNNERLVKIAELGETSIEYLLSGNPYDNMTPEEEEKYLTNQLKLQIKDMNIKQYKEKVHVQLEDFLNNSDRNFYISDYKLNDDDIQSLISLFKGRESNYPTETQIEKEYEEIKRNNEEYQRQIDSGEIFFSMDYRYDINTNENIERDIHTNEDTNTDK